MGKLIPIILAVIGLGGGVGAGLFLRPAAEMGGEEHAMMECVSEDTDGHGEPAAGGHGEPASDGHGAPATDGHGAPVADHGDEADCEPAMETAHEPVAASGGGGHGDAPTGLTYVKLSKQFVVPVVDDGKVAALVVMSLSLEIDASLAETVFIVEPKLRDALLRVMFTHANSGGFDGQFTGGQPMSDLRGSLTEAAQDVLGRSNVSSVLVTDILRQDV